MSFELEKLVDEFSAASQEEMILFFKKNFNDEENLNDVVNLTISGYLSALGNSLLNITNENEIYRKITTKFMETITNTIVSSGHIDEFIIKRKKGNELHN